MTRFDGPPLEPLAPFDLAALAERFPDRTWLEELRPDGSSHRSLRFSELPAAVVGLAEDLLALGEPPMPPRSRSSTVRTDAVATLPPESPAATDPPLFDARRTVALLAADGIDLAVVTLSLLAIGRVAVPLSRREPAARIAAQLTEIGCPLLLSDQAHDALARTAAQRAGAAHRRLPMIATPRYRPRPGASGPEDTLVDDRGTAEERTEADSRTSRPGHPERPALHPPLTLAPDSAATVLFTSGSSGSSKAVLHRLGSHLASAAGSHAVIPLSPGDRWLLSLPCYHIGGLAILIRTLLAGATAVIPASISFRSTDETAALVTTAGRLSHLSLVPTQLLRLLSTAETTEVLRGAKAVLIGGAAAPPGLIRRAVDHDLPVHTSYGSTECASQVTTTPAGFHRDRRADEGTAPIPSGIVLPGRRIAIADNGEILVGGRTLLAGYIRDRRLVRADDAGWFRTGDLGAVRSFGEFSAVLAVHGRTDAMFISGGENIHPEEIVRVIEAHPDVAEAQVVPVPDDEFGQRPVAFVRTASGAAPEQVDAASLEIGNLGLARFKTPIAWLPWPESARAGLKPSRAALIEIACRVLGSPRGPR